MLPLVSALLLAASAAPGHANVFLSPTGSDSGPCTRSAPCRTFGRAYHAARLGDVVEVAAGTYPGEALTGAKAPAAETTEDVVFRAARGARVEITGTLSINVPHVEFANMRIADWQARYDVRDPTAYAAGDITMRDIHTHHFMLVSVHHVRILGGDVGPNSDAGAASSDDGGYVGAWPQGAHVPSDILIDRVTVHDILKPNDGAHSDCVQFTAGVGVVVRNSRFRRCEHADLMIKGDQGPIDRFLIENNVFDRTLSGYWSINLEQTSTGCRNVRIRQNSDLAGFRTDSCTGAAIVGNILPSMSEYQCKQAKVKLDWNLYESGTRCGPHDRVGPAAYVDRRDFDLRVTARSAAIDRGDPASFPAADIVGRRRPYGRAPDLGAFEFGGTGPGATLVVATPRPTAGSSLTVTMAVRGAGSRPLRQTRCNASVARRPIPLLRLEVTASTVSCTWRLPTRAGDRTVSGNVRVPLPGGTVARTFTARVGRA